MRNITFITCVLMPFFLWAQSGETLSLNEGWQFSQANKEQWHDAEVPGSVQRDLVRHGVLPDPFYGTNEEKAQWVEDENWDFRKTFNVTADQLRYDDALLRLEGLDTHADVFLNGSRILRSENMFVGHEVSVRHLLQEGENKLYIRFYSPVQLMMPARATFGYDYPAGNDHREEKLSLYNRTAPYHFGWDWGIRIVQMGIWKPVSLAFYNKARVDDFHVKQESVTAERAKVENHLEIRSIDPRPLEATVTIEYSVDDNINYIEEQVGLMPGWNNFSIPLKINNPKLWMPVNWGDQNMYDFKVKLIVDNEVIAEKTVRTGLRSIRHIFEEDEHGKSYYFEVNGIPIFAKGSNYIPGEI